MRSSGRTSTDDLSQKNSHFLYIDDYFDVNMHQY